MRGIVGLIAIICFGAQAFAYSRSSLRVHNPVQCVVWPFGECGATMTSGWAALLATFDGGHGLAAAVALAVPLLLWWGVALSAHDPKVIVLRQGQKRLSTAALFYLVALLAVAAAVVVEVGAAGPVGRPAPAPARAPAAATK